MEAIEYNGVNLQIISTVKCLRSSIRDVAGNYLHTRHEIEVYAYYGPGATSYTLNGDNLIQQDGLLPGKTDIATLKKLMIPRKLLRVTAGSSVILETPSLDPKTHIRFETDASNGPFCEFVNVPKMIGISLWMVHLRFVAHTNDCQEDISIVSSNTWVSTIDINELYYPTRAVAGKAILRTDMLRAGNVTANSFRSSFFFPISNNYARENIIVKLSEDGASLDWSFVDVARCYNVNPESQIRKAEIWRRSETRQGGGMLANVQTLMHAADTLVDTTNIGTTLHQGVASAFRFIRNNLPHHMMLIHCELWGERDASRNSLTRTALGICLNQFGNVLSSQLSQAAKLGMANINVDQELTEKHVIVDIAYRWSDDTLVYAQTAPGQLLIAGPVDPLDIVPTPVNRLSVGGATVLNTLFDSDARITALNPLRFVPGMGNDPFGFGRNTGNAPVEMMSQRNDWIAAPAPRLGSSSKFVESMVIQVLLEPCQAVPRNDSNSGV